MRDLSRRLFFSISLRHVWVFFPRGMDELCRTGFEFISHSLLGSPLSRELGTTGRGLQGGALLITGAKVSLYLTFKLTTIANTTVVNIIH